MFPLPYANPYAELLYALLGLDLALLCSGLIGGRMAADGTGRLPRPIRMILSVILVAAAALQWRFAGHTPVASYSTWVLAGMALGLLGDLIMARLIPLPDRLIGGMLAFGLGHIVYIAGLVALTTALNGWRVPLHPLLGALLLLIAASLWYGLVQNPHGKPAQNAAALIYSLLMAAMNALALGLAVQHARFIPLAAGAILFLISDLVLGNWNIRGHSWPRVNDVIWVTYNLGQMLIVYSVAAAVNTLI